MFAKQFAAVLAASALLSTAALAQAPAPKDTAPPAQRTEAPAKQEMTQSSNEWRGSKVIGLYVYNDANERLGSINDLLMDSSGKVMKAVIGVGGFLGIGESDVAIEFDKLKFSNEPMRTATTAPPGGAGTTGTTGTGGGATTGAATTAPKPSINPDHAKLSMTKEQLKALPTFKYAN